MAVVKPSYWTHWKTRLLETQSRRPESVTWPIRMWTYCEEMKRWEHENLPDAAIDGICGFHDHQNRAVNPSTLLTECGFLERVGNTVRVHDFEVWNAYLVTAWENGKKGGRPQKSKPAGLPSDNPDEVPDNRLKTYRENREDNNNPPNPLGGGRERAGKGSKGKRFQKPTREAWVEYGAGLEPAFPARAAIEAYDHYETVGWVVGKNRTPMKDWKAACRTSHSKWLEWGKEKKISGARPATALDLTYGMEGTHDE